jgi:diguanylate cyclase (GGDEF)-like protein/PAS domain S-box-containing protein
MTAALLLAWLMVAALALAMAAAWLSLRRKARRLQETERVLRQIIGEMPVALCMVDADLRIYYRNQRFLDQLGFSEQDVPSLREWAVQAYPDPAYRDEAAAQWKRSKAAAVNGQIAARPYRITSRDGAHHVMDVAGMVFGERLLVTFEDHTVHLAQNELLRKLAYVDALTGVPNRRSFDEALAREWSRCGRSRLPLAVLMLDIDHFKAYNDSHGHARGDACLRQVAAALSACLGRGPDLLARYGGEEFVCLLPQCDLAGARAVAERLRQAVLEQQIAHPRSPVAPVLTISVGIACVVPQAGGDPAALVRQADAGLYRSKSQGRNAALEALQCIQN